MRAWQIGCRRCWNLGRRQFTSSSRYKRNRSIADILHHGDSNEALSVTGWVRSVRKQKRIAFAAVSDGSTTHSLQAVWKPDDAAKLSYGSAVRLTGNWTASQGSGQSHELQVSQLEVLGTNNAENSPLQPKYQTSEYLRTIPHLRPRTVNNTILLRLRSQLIAGVTNFFNQEGFIQTHTPIITSSDCEGAGEVFTVSANAASKADEAQPHQHFFRTPKYLTVSAQLHLEALAQAVSKVWTLSPTFRAEQSDTPRHLSEFYMLEAEICFADNLDTIMDLVENMLRSAVTSLHGTQVHKELLELKNTISKDESNDPEKAISAATITTRWDGITAPNWPRITYHEAIQSLQTSVEKGVEFHFPPSYNDGLQAEHERHLATHIGQGKPVFITHYPFDQKPFYMPRSSSADDTVACFDLLVPDLAELVGGSLREHRLPELQQAMKDKGVGGEGLEWYQDLRRFGSVPHGGFGLGFDRLVSYLAGVGSVRDVVAFPRWYGRCDC